MKDFDVRTAARDGSSLTPASRLSRCVCVLGSSVAMWLGAAATEQVVASDAFELGVRTGATTTVEVVDGDSGDDEPSSQSVEIPRESRTSSAASRDEVGIFGRFGHIALPTFGRNDSITRVELAPYVLADDQMLFGDIRLFMTNVAEFGGNAGLGYRRYFPEWDRIFGFSAWYDGDNSTSHYFQQVGASFETYGAIDARGNLYIPLGETEATFGDTVGDVAFVGNSISFNNTQTMGYALRGFDFEVGGQLPTNAGREYDVRGYAGLYYFVGSGEADGITGFRARAQATILQELNGHVEVTADDTFGTNVVFGFSWIFGTGLQHDGGRYSVRDRMGDFPRRNYNVIVAEIADVQSGIEAINPATGMPYSVQHVSTSGGVTAAAGGGAGTSDDPFTSIADAQAAGGDIIFVHADSVINDPIVLQEGERLLGDAADVVHQVEVESFGSVFLPHATDGSDRPTLQSAAGNALTLASNTQVSGFVIDSPVGNGIVGNNVHDVLVSNTDVITPGARGILLEDATGSIGFEDVSISDAGSTGLEVSGGSADVVFQGMIYNESGRSLLVEDTTAGTVDLSEAMITDDGGGILLHLADGNVILGDVSVTDAALHGIEINGGAGSFVFGGQTTVENAGGAGIRVADVSGGVAFSDVDIAASSMNHGAELVDNTGTVSFSSLGITSNGGTGLFASDNDLVEIGGGAIESVNAAAVDIEGTELDVVLTSVSSNGGLFGVRIVESPGGFIVNGTGADGTGGLIENTDTGILLDNAGQVGFQHLDLDDNDTAVSLNDTDEFYLARSNVTGSSDFGIDSMNTGLLMVSNSAFANNGGAGENSIRVQVDAFGSYNNQFLSNDITDGTSTSISVSSSGAGNGSDLALTVDDNRITNTRSGDIGLDVDWSGPLVASLSNNEISGTGGSNVGIDIDTGSTAALGSISVQSNTFVFTGGNDEAARFSTQAPSQLDIGWNTVNLEGASSTGFEFDFAQATDAYIHSNLIVDEAGGGTGIDFASIAAAADVTVDDNLIQLFGTGIIDRGIIFSSVTGSVDLFGEFNNAVIDATTPFFAPAGSTTGAIFVNGVAVP